MLAAEQAVPIIRRHQQRIAAGTRRVIRTADLAWLSLAPVDDQALASFVERIAPMVRVLRSTAAEQTRSTLGLYLGLAGAVPPVLDLEQLTATVRGGRSVDELLARPTTAVRWALGEGTPWQAALQLGQSRLRELIATDAVVVQQAVETATMTGTPGVVGWRRVPNVGACELCLAAATQRYRTGQLRAVHEWCGCGVAPIVGDMDPGRVIDRLTRDEAKAAGVDVAAARAHTIAVDDPELGRRLTTR